MKSWITYQISAVYQGYPNFTTHSADSQQLERDWWANKGRNVEQQQHSKRLHFEWGSRQPKDDCVHQLLLIYCLSWYENLLSNLVLSTIFIKSSKLYKQATMPEWRMQLQYTGSGLGLGKLTECTIANHAVRSCSPRSTTSFPGFFPMLWSSPGNEVARSIKRNKQKN